MDKNENDIHSFYEQDILKRKGFVFTHNIEKRVKDSVDFIEAKYESKEQLYLSLDFIEFCMTEAIKPYIPIIDKVGFFPITEAELELDYAIKHALIGSYKAAFSDLRRALELVLVSVYFTSENIDLVKAHKWLESQLDTPYFSTLIKEIIQKSRYNEFNDLYQWEKNLKNLNWKISDFIHNKGMKKGYRELNRAAVFEYIGRTHVPVINYDTLQKFLDCFNEVIGEISVILTLDNPVILFALPIDEKYGFNPPVSGFFQEYESEVLHKILPDKYKSYFYNLMENDFVANSIVNHIKSLPDLTNEELDRQEELYNLLDKDKNP